MALYYSKDFFDQHDKKYDYIADEDIAFLLRRVPSFQSTGIVLDLACGSGAVGEKIQQLFPNIQVIGADICLNLLKWSEYPVCQSNAFQLPFKGDSFDCIIVAAAFHHFGHRNIEKVANECFRCLKQKGSFVAYDPNKYHPQRFIMMTNPLRYFFYKNGDHAISPHYFKKILLKTKFKNISITFFSLKGRGSGHLSRLNYNVFVNISNSKLKLLLPVLSPWFIITGIK